MDEGRRKAAVLGESGQMVQGVVMADKPLTKGAANWLNLRLEADFLGELSAQVDEFANMLLQRLANQISTDHSLDESSRT